MNSFELNKVLGAILGTFLVLLALHIGADALFATEKPAKPGYDIVVARAGTKAAPKKVETPLPVLLAHANVNKGKQIAKQCEACHTLQKGEPNKIGPNLYNVVDAAVAEGRGGYKFSAALQKKGGKWTYEKLFVWIKDPRADVPGTLMTFAGIKSPQERADVIAYLRTLSDNPKPLPKVEAAPKSAAKPAAEQKKAAAPAQKTLAQMFADASVDKGKQIARQCQACHTLQKGEPNKIGPNLYNVVDAAVAEGRGGYKFSAALKKKGGKWTYQRLFEWLKDPRAYVPGTMMTFAGIKNPQKRVDVIAYLRTLSDNPKPLPKVEAAPKSAAKPAGEQKKAAAPAQKTLAQMFADASVDKGKQIARQCQACHTLQKGQPNRVGPNLYNVVGAQVAEGRGGYNFSAALKKKGGKWTYQRLFEWLKDPRAYVPGTMMTFAGIKNPQKRVDVIAYLRTLSDNPQPPPK